MKKNDGASGPVKKENEIEEKETDQTHRVLLVLAGHCKDLCIMVETQGRDWRRQLSKCLNQLGLLSGRRQERFIVCKMLRHGERI